MTMRKLYHESPHIEPFKCENSEDAKLRHRLGRHEKNWVEELSSVLWAIRTTEKTSHGRTPFGLVFGIEAMIPAEIGVHSPRRTGFRNPSNKEDLMLNLELTEERRENARMKEAKYKKHLENYSDSRVRHKTLSPGDMVLRKNEDSRQQST
ncbi:hypothetical protein L1987_60375 [Smallanthus sonchifolius]|uniref:Uncharacterized protein n=1 Tax=Smallanthus sonchifolius TaxID=185202 RepID=A0ACB9D815_9ASTR|nr:hypothetical protein L1987_60375 [Smallanthus sonchifolius]